MACRGWKRLLEPSLNGGRPPHSLPCRFLNTTNVQKVASTSEKTLEDMERVPAVGPKSPPSSSLPTPVKQRVDRLKEDLASDVYTTMLATPLRRCSVTHAVLPKALMFKLKPNRAQVSYDIQLKPLPQIIKDQIKEKGKGKAKEKEVGKDIEKEEDDGEEKVGKELEHLPKVLVRQIKMQKKRSERRQARRELHKSHLRAVRMATVKVKTCRVEDRERFETLLKETKAAEEELVKQGEPDERAPLMPAEILHPRAQPLQPGVKTEKGLWVTLDRVVLAEALKRRIHSRFPKALPPPSNLEDTITSELQQRVLQEAQFLYQRVASGPLPRRGGELQTEHVPWLVKQQVKSEALAKMGKNSDESMESSRHLGCESISAILNFGQYDDSQAQAPITRMGHTIPLFRMDKLLSSEEEGKDLSRHLEKTFQVLKKRVGRAQKKGGITLSNGILDEEMSSNKEDERDTREPVQLIRRHNLTIDLVAALWRLQIWHNS